MKKRKPQKVYKFNQGPELKLMQGDALEKLKNIPDNSVSLIITSPPYNLGKEYETKVTIEKYLEAQKEIISLLVGKLKNSGSICWQVGNFTSGGEIFPLDIFYYRIFKDNHKLQLRNRIIWKYGHGLHAQSKFSGRYETILWFTKTKNYTFNLDPIRIQSKYPGKRYSKGRKKGRPSGNPMGKNPSDIWEIIKNDWDSGVWEIPNVKANHIEKTSHPCQFPIALVERCVLALTNADDLVLDPYAGVSSALIAAIKNNRRAIGIEKEEKYVKISLKRIRSFYKGDLGMRPLEKPIHVPSSNMTVAQVPVEWKKVKKSIYKNGEEKNIIRSLVAKLLGI